MHNPFKSHYEVLSKVDLTECKKLASQLSNCVEAYLIKIGYSSGGSIGWLGSFYIFGKFDNPEGEYLVPLKIFNNRNAALNAIREAY